MSCISEILKLKGDKPVLVDLDADGEPWIAVEGGGKYKDYEFIIVLNTSGHRCGYVALPPGHPLNDVGENEFSAKRGKTGTLDYDKMDIDCHGGLTFASNDHGLKSLLSTPCTDNWIGFDCGHLFDLPDQEKHKEYYKDKVRPYSSVFCDPGSEIRDYQYVENQCKSIIEQLIKKAA